MSYPSKIQFAEVVVVLRGLGIDYADVIDVQIDAHSVRVTNPLRDAAGTVTTIIPIER